MKLLTCKRLRVEKDIIVRVRRILKGEGKILISEGREVMPEEIIGTSTQFRGFRTMNLSNLLRVKPSDVSKYIKRAVGQRIYKDELLAFKKGALFTADKVITSPTDGILDFINNLTGEVRISLLPKKIALPAGVYGVVEKVDEKIGLCLIRAQVTKIYGIFGIGRIRDGTLKMVTKRDGIISKAMISPNFDNYILAAGSLQSKDTLHSAISAGVNGLIIGGINATDYKDVLGGHISFQRKLDEDMGVSLVICEGFGAIGLGEDIDEILKKYDGKFISIDGNNACISLPSYLSSSMIKVRATKLPGDLAGSVSKSQEELTEIHDGVKVRIIGASFTGEQGQVVSQDQTESLLPSQIRSNMVTVETKRRKIRLPFQNLEIVQ